MKQTLHFLIRLALIVLAITIVGSAFPQKTQAASFNQNLIMDDEVFDNAGSMSASQIDAFLNSLPSSCISPNSGFAAIEPIGYNPTEGYKFGGYVTAGQVIASAAQAYGINPQVLLATLQKEQSLVSASQTYCNDGNQHKYAAAVGYGCPDNITTHSYSGLSLYRRNGTVVSDTGTTCVTSASKAGFSQQVIRAAWLFKFGQQRSKGNVGWAVIKGSWDNSDDPQSCYGGPMTQGTFQRCPSGAASYFDGYTTIDNIAVHIDTGPTAALYWYTPHFHGNQNFFDLFTGWFGGTVSGNYYSCHNSTNVNGAATGETVLSNRMGAVSENLSIVQPNNTGSACVEVHTWANNRFQQWLQHTATNSPAADPASNGIITADTNADGRDEMYYINYQGTSSGMIEFHGWDRTYHHWVSHVASNRSSLNPADAEVISADAAGDGRDEFYLIQYRNTGSGMVEIHGWSANQQQWVSHIATNMPAVDPADYRVIASDSNGDGRDEFYLVKYQNTGSGMVEIHGWTPNFQQWTSHIATNHSSLNQTNNKIMAADINGDYRDEFFLVQYRSTGSGMVEIHGWTPNFQQWTSHIVTSQGAL